MKKEIFSSPMSRRTFIKGLGLAAGSTVFSLAPMTLASSGSPVKIGVLVPESRIYPALGESMLAGMRLFLEEAKERIAGLRMELITRNSGIYPSQAVEISRQLIEDARVDFVVGAVNSSVPESLRDLLEKSRTVFILSGIEAKMPDQKERSPFVFSNSINYWQASWAMGTWTAPNLGKKAILASSFYDSGYDTLYAFRLGFEGAGGQILSTHVTDTPGREGGMSEFITELKRERPDFVYALYCGQDAIAFMKAWEESGLSGKIPLAGSGFFVDESLLSAHGHAAQRTRSSFPWSPVLELPENKAFVHSYRERTGRHADAFSMLGYETARLIMQAVHAVSGETRKTDALIAALGDAQFASPRGRFKMDSRTHTSRSPLYLREVERSGSSFSNKVISELNPVNDEDDLVTAMQTGFRTGWLNAYLSV